MPNDLEGFLYSNFWLNNLLDQSLNFAAALLPFFWALFDFQTFNCGVLKEEQFFDLCTKSWNENHCFVTVDLAD